MILIKVNIPYATVDCSDDLKRELYNYFAVEIPGAQFNPRWRNAIRWGKWDGKVHPFQREGKCPFGLVDLIKNYYHGPIDVSGDYVPDYKYIKRCLRRLKKIKLYGIESLSDFQKLAVKRMILNQRGIVKVATNGGKTEIASAAIGCLKGLKVLYMIHLKTLLHQTAERIEERLRIKVGRIGDGIKNIKPITVAMIQSLPKPTKQNSGFYDQWDVIIMDEGHHSGSAKTWHQIALKCRAPWRFVLSGTPWTGVDMKDVQLISNFGSKVLANVKNRELIERGWSARPIVHVWEQNYKHNNMSWRLAYDSMIVGDVSYNEKIISIVKRSWENGDPVLVIVNQKRHGLLLHRRLDGEKIDHKYLTGSNKTEDIQKALKKFKAGRLGAIIATPIFDEG